MPVEVVKVLMKCVVGGICVREYVRLVLIEEFLQYLVQLNGFGSEVSPNKRDTVLARDDTSCEISIRPLRDSLKKPPKTVPTEAVALG